MHRVLDVHATALSSLEYAPLGTAACCSCHLVPFQLSVIGAVKSGRVSYCPTAMHSFLVGHAIPANSPFGSGGATVCCTVQVARDAGVAELMLAGAKQKAALVRHRTPAETAHTLFFTYSPFTLA